MKNTKGLSRRTMLKGAAATIGIGALGYGLYRTGVFQGQSKSPEDVPAAPISKNKHPVSGVEVSALGMGCMRFPMQPGASSPRGPEIDEDAAFKLVNYALDSGINYFDTAYFYHGGASEAVLGRALARHPRESYLVADKMPGRIIESLSHAKEVFKGQLAKLKTDSIDFYQLHAVMGVPDYQKIYEEYGVLDFLLEQREKGVIKHLGWSFHGDVEALEYLLSRDVPWDYAMLQLNYHDLLHKLVMPERRAKIIGLDKQPAPAHWMYEKVRDAGIPIVVMEPLLGGRLARLSKKARQVLENARPDLTPAAWAFRFVANLPGVLTVLSGMTYMDHLRENRKTFSPLEHFGKEEENVLRAALSVYLNKDSVPCTTCGYCMPCPYGVNIPAIFTHLNASLDDDYFPRDSDKASYDAKAKKYLANYDRVTPRLSQAVHCTGCGKCLPLCPNMINIPAEMARIGKLDEGLRNGVVI